MTRLNPVLLLILIACALALVTSQHRARKLYVQLQQELELEKKLEVDWNQLQLEQGTWAVHARIEKMATQQLHMRAVSAARTQLAPYVAPYSGEPTR